MANQTDIGVTISTKIEKAINNVNRLNSQLEKTQQHLNALGIKGSSISTSLSNMNTSKVKSLSNETKKASTGFNSLSNSIKKATNGLNKGFDLGKMYFMWNRLKPIMQGLAGIINKSVDYTETVNLFRNAMGEMSNIAMGFQNKLSETFGTAQTSMMKYQATYKNMLSALGGINDQVSEKISETLTLMSIDYASLYNVEMEDAAAKFQSALSRQVRPIRSTSGYDITQNVLGQYLQMAGIYDRTVSDLSEMEKRLLIIYSLQQQMANSNAFGDFARTIESPANQLRVLQEQLAETGRWIGSVFYSTLGKVLPYINGFIMAVKEAVKWVALLFGYEVEDYSSGGSTYFDQAFGDAGDTLDNVSSGVGSVNSGLDDTKKKAEEVKESLSGLDELNIITSTNDSSGGGSGGSGGGGGLGSAGIDPRLLSALGEYEDMLNKIRMKANDIRDRLLEWGSIVGEYVNENIFKPIEVSWNKYGESILSRFSDGFSNIGSIIGDAFVISDKHLAESVESISSLFFTLLDDLAIAFDGITKLLKSIWDNGGNVLFEQLIRLKNSILDLATSINDNFVKPILKWFADDIAPTLGKVLGKIVGLFGSVVGILADVTKAFAENKNAVKAVCTILTTMFALYKTGQVVNYVNKWVNVFRTYKDAGSSTLTILGSLLEGHTTILSKGCTSLSKYFTNINSGANLVKTAFTGLTSIVGNMFNTFVSVGSSTTSIFKSIEVGASFAEGGVGLLYKALNALTSPVGLLITGFVALSGVAMYLSRDYNGLTGASAEYVEKLKEQQKELDETTQKIRDNQQATRDKIETIDSEYIAVDRAVQKLNEMVDANGKVNGSQETAQTYIDQINSKLGTNIQIQDGVIQNWKDEKTALDKTIESMKQKAVIEAHYDAYVEALKNEKELSVAVSNAKRDLAENEEQLNQKYQRFNELTALGSSMTAQQVEEHQRLSQEISNLTTTHGELETTLEKAQLAYDSNQKSITDYDLACQAASGDISAIAQSMVADYEVMGNKSTATWASMGDGLKDLTAKHDDYVKNNADMNSKEVKSNEEATKVIMQHMVEKANKYGYSYEEMLSYLEKYGTKLTKDEKAKLQEQYQNYVKNANDVTSADVSKWNKLSSQTSIKMSDLTTSQKKKLDEALKTFQKNGDQTGIDYCTKLANALKNNGGKTDKETKEIIRNIEKQAKDSKPESTIKTSVSQDAINKANEKLRKGINDVTAKIKLTPNANGIKIGDQKFAFKMYASGGFPEDGLFMANHGELVGRFANGRTAVANNNQIIQGIQAGVYQAVYEAMQNSGSNNNLIQVYIGKKKIFEEMQNADKESLMKTGKVKFGT